jgi:putative Mn2+ efflux pump MntP
MKRPTLADLANFAQFVSILAAMITIFLGFLLPFSYLSNRAAVWLLPKMASSQYASLFVVAFMMVMLLMAVPAIVAFVLSRIQRDIPLQHRGCCGATMIVVGAVLAYFAQKWLVPWYGLLAAIAAVAFLGLGIDILLGFWEPATCEPTKDAGSDGVRTEAGAPCGKWCKTVSCKPWQSILGRGICNWLIRAVGGFLALVILWNEAAAAVSTKLMTHNENGRVALFLIAMAVLLTTFGNGLGISIAKHRKDPDKALSVVAISAFVTLFLAMRCAPVALFAMRLSGMGGIYEFVHLKPSVNEERLLPGFGSKPQHGALEVCMVAQSGRTFYVSGPDKGTNKGKSKGGPGACAEQINGPYSYCIWRLPRTDVAWVKEWKPPTKAQ